MRGYTKEDIKHHNDGGIGGPYHPAVNVKCYHFGPSLESVADRFGCSEDTAQKALEYAFEAQQDSFWNCDGARMLVDEYFPTQFCYVRGSKHGGHNFYSAGRSGGWLVVTSLPDVGEWDGIALNRWACFERAVKAEVEYLCSDENVLELIEINRWSEDAQALESAIGEVLEPVS